MAAAGIVALEQQRDRLIEDHQNARLLAERIASNPGIKVTPAEVQTNIVKMDVSPSGRDAQMFAQLLESKGLKANAVSDRFIRMVTYREIGREDVLKAAEIIKACCREL